jgi:hypothetical protein
MATEAMASPEGLLTVASVHTVDAFEVDPAFVENTR